MKVDAAKNPLRVGVCGVGSLGQHHARIYAQLEGVKLAGVYDIDAARAAEVAQRHGTRAWPDLASFSAAVEAASLAVPTDRHHAVATRLLEQGVHLLVEKPIAFTMGEAEDMVRGAREKGLVLQVGHIERFNPVMKFLEEHIVRPRFIEAIRLAPYPPPREAAVPRGTEVSVVLDLMIHDLEIILHLVRAPILEIHAAGVPVLSPAEDIANCRLVFEGGCVANVTASRISREKKRKIRVFQEDSYVSLDYMNQTGQLMRKSAQGLSVEDVPVERSDALTEELRSFVRCVTQRHEPAVSGQHGSEALRLAIEICRCIRENPS
jgi:predicted dehydrogenase